METPIIAALTAALVSGAFGILNYALLRIGRKREEALRHLQRQIEELYSPLLGLIQYGAAVNKIEQQILPHGARDDNEGEVLRHIREEYYLPLNAQMVDLIRAKVYLLETDTLPESFQQFIIHAAQFNCLHNLWKELGVRGDHIKAVEYPEAFRRDVESTLNRLREKYQRHIPKLAGAKRKALRAWGFRTIDK